MTNESIFKCSFPHQQKTQDVMQHIPTFSKSVRLIRTTTTLSQGWGHKNILYSWDEQKVPTFFTGKHLPPNYEILLLWIQLLLVPAAQASNCIFCTSCPQFLISFTTILQDKVRNLAFPYQRSSSFFPFHLLITKIKEYKQLLSHPV